MLMHPSLLISFIFLLLPLVFCSSITKFGCPDRCGNLSIPFPLGVGSNCSIGPAFDIICGTSANPPKACLTINNTEVNKIELDTPRIRVNYPNPALACYHLSGYQYVNFSATQYTFPDDNWLAAIGCDDMVTGIVFYNQKLEGGCVSYCSDMDDSDGIRSCPGEVISRFSPGNGCCRIPIPKGPTYLRASLSDLHAKWQQQSRLFPCSFAFVGERTTWDSAEFSSYQLGHLHGNSMATLNDTVVPSVQLDWRIGAENCTQAEQNSTTHACQDNSICVDFDANIGGYNCRCLEGYEGNPYLALGCHGSCVPYKLSTFILLKIILPS